MPSQYLFKIAETDSEFERISELNYKTFVEEIPQHKKNESQRLVDKFHEENIYLICTKNDVLQGMVALRDKRPFSLDAKVENLDQYLPENRNIVEVRLLSVIPSARTGRVLKGLLDLLIEFNRTKHWNLGVISGTTRQVKLYRRMGFVPFGPLVGTEGAYYQPMYIEMEAFRSQTKKVIKHAGETFNFLPGPVTISTNIHKAFVKPPISHRSIEFLDSMVDCEIRLKELTKARHALIALGSGTLANDMVAAQLSLLSGRGLILANGEFGERLIGQARRFGASFDTFEIPWGQSFNTNELESKLDSTSYEWLWMTVCETSTGMRNNFVEISQLCLRREIKLCADCVSALGAYPINLESVYLASGTSGKALGSYPGLAIVFHNHEISSSPLIPKYLDIGFFHENQNIPFSHSSNLVSALKAALKGFAEPMVRYKFIESLAEKLRIGLENAGLPILVKREQSSPAIFTIPLPAGINSRDFSKQLKLIGIIVASESNYLIERNWIQICLMGDIGEKAISYLQGHLTKENSHFRKMLSGT